MAKDIQFHTTTLMTNLATDQVPTYSIDRTRKIIKRGKKNDNPEYLLFLLNNHAEHGSIVRGKASYLTGLGISTDNEHPAVKQFLDFANPFESWHELDSKTDLDDCTFGGHFLKVVTNALGTPIHWYHIENAKVRISDDFCSYVVSEDWSKVYASDRTYYPKYKPGVVGESIEYIKKYTPSANSVQSAYSQPEYTSCILDVDTDVRVGTFFNNYVKNNFSSGTMIVLYTGETDPAKKQAMVDRIKGEHTSEDEAGKPVVVFANKDGKGAEVITLNSSDLDKQYVEVSKRNKEKIVAGHGVSGTLFKVKLDDGVMFTKEQIDLEHELFINEYVKVKQVAKNKRRAKWCLLKTGQVATFDTQQIKIIGLELPLENQTVVNALNTKDPNIILNYLIDKYSIDVPKNVSDPAMPVQEAAVNENLKNLTGRQFQGLMRIVKKYDDKKISKESAVALMKSGFGVSEAEALTFLNIADEDEETASTQINASVQKEDKQKMFFTLFNKYAHDISDDEVLDVEIVGCKVNMASEKPTDTELRNAILNQLKGNPYLSVRDLAQNFKVDESVIQKSLSWMSEKGLINALEGTFQPTEKAMNKETDNLETEIYTEYTYGLREDQKGTPLVLPTTRDFCREMVALTRSKAISYDDIQNLSKELTEDAWSFRGGFYNDGEQTTPWCRHVWLGTTKIRRKKK